MCHGVSVGEKLPEVVEENRVEDDGGPAQEEDHRDQAEEDVGPTTTTVHAGVLTWGPS